MSLTEQEVQQSLNILHSLDDALEKGPWQDSLFLKNLGKKLQDARDRFVQELGLEAIINAKEAEALSAGTIPDQETLEVYVSLYQTEGANLAKWITVLESLPKLGISRPVYKSEADIQAAIRAKEYKTNDAYVAVKILRTTVLGHSVKGRILHDRFGKELLLLKEGSVRRENMKRFVHISGVYDVVNGQLHKRLGVEEVFKS